MQYNMNNPAVKRILREVNELRKEPSDDYTAAPLEDNLFEWHFTIRGPPDSVFEGGVYHGRIVLPLNYPFKPPDFFFLTPNGRFELGTKICLSISGFHPEDWQPSWSVRTALIALIAFMVSDETSVGSLEYPPSERRALASRSVHWECAKCGPIAPLLTGGGACKNGDEVPTASAVAPAPAALEDAPPSPALVPAAAPAVPAAPAARPASLPAVMFFNFLIVLLVAVIVGLLLRRTSL
mmetsp:Transcript_11415/g.28798  ORF Transcript_11415/g.28798 Transcript_11415/m.28798 type:complete len:238 (-) Transcript_11415:293-1006(-)